MNKRMLHIIQFIFGILLFSNMLNASDWPVYKGNIYFTGNNDEITVKNNNLKWLFQADELVYNPIVSGNKVYCVDIKKIVYCLNENTGKLLWRIDLTKVSAQFHTRTRSAGKIKYPLIKGDRLFLTDNIAIYCLNKHNGTVLWARTGFRNEVKIHKPRSWRVDKTHKWEPGKRKKWDPAMHSHSIVDFIYSNPVINQDLIYYGTRNVFISRDITDGHLQWNNMHVRSYSGFPSFYDDYIFTQSMDYSANRFSLFCMSALDGTVKWIKRIDKPFKIFSPVVYKRKVYLASDKKLYCLNIKNGEIIWDKDYPDLITSNPSFTERAILFTVGNKSVYMVDPANGAVLKQLNLGAKSSPYYVTIRDQIYISKTFPKTVGKRSLSFSSVRAIKMENQKVLWEFIPPFPGGSGQPVASRGILIFPAGNYLYAVGTDYYPRIIKGGDGYYDPYSRLDDRKGDDLKNTRKNMEQQRKQVKNKKKEIPLRDMEITVGDKSNRPIVPAEIEIKKWDDGKIIYSKKVRISKPNQVIRVPDMDDVEITGNAPGYLPKKVIVSRKDKKKTINLEKIEKGKSVVVDNIYFEFNEAYLKKESLNIIDQIINSMKRNKRIKLEVQGHTDSVGPDSYNKKLSERRADAVVEYMIKNGISPERVKGVGYGEEKPIADNKSRNGRQKNRRTEFLILDK